MDWKRTERLVAAFVFLYALALYLLTVSPTASFWDSGEFIAIANRLEVSHPPGAPFYMLVGRLFSMFIPPAYVALSINLISVLASALTVLMTHLIIVRLMREWQPEPRTSADRIVALVGGVVGACTFAATDSFWFNAVEAEVYAASMFFTALVVWLILRWRDLAREEEAARSGLHRHPLGLMANRYLVLIAYLFGLAIGVHLLNLLAIFFIALIIFYTEYEQPDWTPAQWVRGLVLTGIVAMLGFGMVFPVTVQWLPDWAGKFNSLPLFLTFILAVVTGALYYTQKNRMQAANLIVLCMTMILIGYSTYALIFIRSAADPPIDENDPETTEAIVSYLKREQYGQTPLLSGYTYNNRIGRIDTRRKVSFPRRYSQDPNHEREYRNYPSDLSFFLHYQVNHMYVRYFLWNFVGKASDVQDAPAIVTFSDRRAEPYFQQTPSEKASRNAYYGLPLLLGLMGMGFHFLRDWRRAFSVLILFLVTGLGIILYLNQTPMQPRERDYSYVASFFAFSLWVGIGATGVLQLLREAVEDRLAAFATGGMLWSVGGVLFLIVPLWMAMVNFDDHDRSGRYVAPDYAYNMLMSLDQNAVLFTNGDNDTFPLWYLQEVEGIRRDVRVVNLSLLNTQWYIRQLKNQQARESAPLPISFSDAQIDNLNFIRWTPREVALPVDRRRLLEDTALSIPAPDTSLIMSPMKWTPEGRPFGRDEAGNEVRVMHIADQVALNMLMTNARDGWKRPIYFAVTVSPDGQLDLQHFFQLEGQAYRVVPIRNESTLGRVVPTITPERLRKFRFTGLNDPDVYFDENIRRMVDNYRNIFAHTAQSLLEQGLRDEARALMDDLMEKVPFETIPGDEFTLQMVAQTYQALGDEARMVEVIKKAEDLLLHRLAHLRNTRDVELAVRNAQVIQYLYIVARDFEAASALGNRVADISQNPAWRTTPEEIQRLYESSSLGNEEQQP